MSGTSAGKPAMPAQAGGTGDPSMEDILASIRRILDEDESHQPPPVAVDDVLTLDASMRADAPSPEAEGRHAAFAYPPATAPVETIMEEFVPAADSAALPDETPDPATLLAPEAAAATTASVSGLIRTLAEQQAVGVHHGGPTLEDIVREELRPLLKSWLDHNLPPLVERVVSAEIQRLIGRAFP